MIAVTVYQRQASVHAGMSLPLGRLPRGVAELHVAVKCVSLYFSIEERSAEVNRLGPLGPPVNGVQRQREEQGPEI